LTTNPTAGGAQNPNVGQVPNAGGQFNPGTGVQNPNVGQIPNTPGQFNPYAPGVQNPNIGQFPNTGAPTNPAQVPPTASSPLNNPALAIPGVNSPVTNPAVPPAGTSPPVRSNIQRNPYTPNMNTFVAGSGYSGLGGTTVNDSGKSKQPGYNPLGQGTRPGDIAAPGVSQPVAPNTPGSNTPPVPGAGSFLPPQIIPSR
jgi:hypothetical protein